MFENIHPNMYDGDKFKGSSLEGKSLRVVVSEVIYKHNVLCKCSSNDYLEPSLTGGRSKFSLRQQLQQL